MGVAGVRWTEQGGGHLLSTLGVLCIFAAELLTLSLVSCDGGQKSADHKPELIFSNNPNSPRM